MKVLKSCFKMKWYPSILEVEKTDELKALFKVSIFYFEFRFCRTIKRDASLSGLNKIECSSIKIKSKERHSNTSQARRIVPETFGVRSPDVSRNSQPSEVLNQVKNPDAQSLSLRGDCDRRKSRRGSELQTVGSPDSGRESRHMATWLPCRPCASKVPTYVGSPDRRKS